MLSDIKKFIKKILLVIIPICFILFLIEYQLRKIPNRYKIKRQYFEQQLDSLHVLILGSSQAWYGVNPDYFAEKGFNLAYDGQSLFYDTQITLKYLNKMPKLKCVIISVSYFSLWYQICTQPESWRDYCYSNSWNIIYPDIKWYNPKNYFLFMIYTPSEIMELTNKKKFHTLLYNFKSNGWYHIDTNKNNIIAINEKIGSAKLFKHKKMMFESNFNNNIRILDDFINKCTKKNIKIIFITTPCDYTYSKFTDSIINFKNKRNILFLCKKYNCQYFDYFTDKRFTINDFSDNDHLNFIGAEKFSKILNNDIISKFQITQLNK